MWHTDVPSIQGTWTPFMLRSPEANLATYPNDKDGQPLDREQSATEKLIELFKQQKIGANADGDKAADELLQTKRAE